MAEGVRKYLAEFIGTFEGLRIFYKRENFRYRKLFILFRFGKYILRSSVPGNFRYMGGF